MKTTLSFNAQELRVIYIALNNYSLENMETSKTWGDYESILTNKKDVWHRDAEAAEAISSRIYQAELRLEKKATTQKETVAI